MSVVEIHLIMNHIPIIGIAFVSVQLFLGLVYKNTFLQKVALWFLISCALVSIAVYFSGLGSEDIVKPLPGTSIAYLQLHEKVARIATVTTCAIGGIAFLSVVVLRNRDELFKYFIRGIFAMTLLSTALFTLTGYLGGQIRHTEISSTLAEGLPTRTITIGVTGIMMVIVIIMIVPLYLNKDKIFKKVEVVSSAGSGGGQGSQSYRDFRSWSQHERADSRDNLLMVREHKLLTEEETMPLPSLFRKPERPQEGKRRLLIGLAIICTALIVTGGLGFFLFRTYTKQAPLQLQTIADVSVSNQTARFDYQGLDPQRGLLFITHSGANSVLIFDTRSNKVIAEVPGIEDGHGVVAISELGRVYVSAGGTNEVVAIDEQTHRILARIPTGAGPDGIAYDPIDHKLFVSDENGHSDTVIDVLSEKKIATISLGGEAGNTQYDPVSKRIFVNVQTLRQLVAIDPKNYNIVGRYPLSNCDHNHGLNIDWAQSLAFIACDASNTLLMVDMHSMKILDTASLSVGADVLALDSDRHILYVASESGIVSVFKVGTSTVHKLAAGYVGIHAHTLAVNQQTHAIYLPLQNVNGRSIVKVAMFQP